MTYTKGAVDLAKRNKLHLVKLEINGRYAKDDIATVTGPIGPKTAELAWELFVRMSDAKRRKE